MAFEKGQRRNYYDANHTSILVSKSAEAYRSVIRAVESMILWDLNRGLVVHYDTSAMKRFLASVSLQHEPKVSDVITLVNKTFFARVSYEILYHEVWKWVLSNRILHTEWYKNFYSCSRGSYGFVQHVTFAYRTQRLGSFKILRANREKFFYLHWLFAESANQPPWAWSVKPPWWVVIGNIYRILQ